MNTLDHVVTNNISNKNQYNEDIEYDPKFDNKFSLSSRIKDLFPVVTVSFIQGKNII